MFLKPTRSGGHTYLQLVESYRNEAGQPRQRSVASVGRLDEVGGGVDSLLAGLLRHKGLPASAALPPALQFDPALSFGDVSALDQIWCELGFDALAGVFEVVGLSVTNCVRAHRPRKRSSRPRLRHVSNQLPNPAVADQAFAKKHGFS